MAENEILDIKAVGWRRSRMLFASAGESAPALADCVADELETNLQRSLNYGFRKGITLLTVLKAVGKGPAEMTAAILSFKHRSLARLVRDTLTLSGNDTDVSRISQLAAGLLINRTVDMFAGLASTQAHFADDAKRAALRLTLTERLSESRHVIAAQLEQSLKGAQAGSPNKTRQPRPSVEVRAQSVLGTSLLLPRGEQSARRRRH